MSDERKEIKTKRNYYTSARGCSKRRVRYIDISAGFRSHDGFGDVQLEKLFTVKRGHIDDHRAWRALTSLATSNISATCSPLFSQLEQPSMAELYAVRQSHERSRMMTIAFSCVTDSTSDLAGVTCHGNGRLYSIRTNQV